jgi:hypothetical protein
LYFTDLDDIARNYAEKLRKGGEDVVVNNIAQESLNSHNGDVIKALEDLSSTLKESWSDKKRVKKAIKILETGKFKKVPKTNLYKVSLHKGKTPSEYTWLEWDKPFDNELRDKLSKKYLEFSLKENKTGTYQFQRGSKWYKGTKIGDNWVWRDRYTNNVIDFKEIEKASEENFKDEVRGNQSNKNTRLYQAIANYYKSEMAEDGDKFASLFLLENGIDGIKYPAESISRGANSDNARGFNYVVFDENAVTIEEQIKFLKDKNERIYGFYNPQNNQIYLTEEVMNSDTLTHELYHFFAPVLRNQASSGNKTAEALLKRFDELALTVLGEKIN